MQKDIYIYMYNKNNKSLQTILIHILKIMNKNKIYLLKVTIFMIQGWNLLINQ